MKKIILLPIFLFIIFFITLNSSADINSERKMTVMDSFTALRWTKCSMLDNNEVDSSVECSGNHKKYSWENSLTACESLNFAGITNWRLPNIKELQSIVAYETSHAPRIDSDLFPNTADYYYWSSTSYNNTAGHPLAWSINFLYGETHIGYKESFSYTNPFNHVTYDYDKDFYYVRCVSGPFE